MMDALQLWVDTKGWTAVTLDDFISDVLRLAADGYGATTAHIELPISLWNTLPQPEPAECEDERCRSVQVKPMHSYTRTNSKRTVQGSSWRCVLKLGHSGMHRADDSAHQAPWV